MRKIIYLFAISLVAFACNEEEITVIQNANLEPALEFNDLDQILNFIDDKVNNTGITSREAEIEDNGFISFEEVYHRAMDELDLIESSEEESMFLAKYNDIIILEDSVFTPKIKNPYYQKICNRNGIYISEGFAHKVIDEKSIIITDKNNLKDLKAISTTNGLNNNFRVVRYSGLNEPDNNPSRLANCGSGMTKDYFNNNNKCKNDRKVIATAYTSLMVSNYYYTPLVLFTTHGLIRTWTCKWKEYRTTLATRNAWFNVLLKINGQNVDYYKSFPNQSSNGDVWNIVLHQGEVTSNPIKYNYYSGTPVSYFTGFNLEGTSRGVGDNWVRINCQ